LAIRTLANMSGSDRPLCTEHAFGWRAARAADPSPIAVGALRVAHGLGPSLRRTEPASKRRVIEFAANLRSLSSWTEPSFAATLGFRVRFVDQAPLTRAQEGGSK
jgi:hypothetical protein